MPRSCAKDRTRPWCLKGSLSESGASEVVGTRSSSLDGGSLAECLFWGSSFSSLSELLYCWILCIGFVSRSRAWMPSIEEKRLSTFTLWRGKCRCCYSSRRGRRKRGAIIRTFCHFAVYMRYKTGIKRNMSAAKTHTLVLLDRLEQTVGFKQNAQ